MMISFAAIIRRHAATDNINIASAISIYADIVIFAAITLPFFTCYFYTFPHEGHC